MAAHTLHLTIVGANFSAIETEAAVHVARYTHWDLAEARRFVAANANVDLHPIERRPRLGVVYRADVTITV